MVRIEWAARGGDEVETVVSMLIFNEHPRATRIRPSQGDFGIDILAPHPGDASFAVERCSDCLVSCHSRGDCATARRVKLRSGEPVSKSRWVDTHLRPRLGK